MRFVAAFLVLFSLWLLPHGSAFAQQGSCSSSRTLGTDYGCAGPGEALSAAVAAGESQKSSYANQSGWSWNCQKLYVPDQLGYSYHCVATGSGFTYANFQYDRYWSSSFQCPSGQSWDPDVESCVTPCSSRPASTTPFYPPNGSTQCIDGCIASYANASDATGSVSYRSFTGQKCTDVPPCADRDGGGKWVVNTYLGVCQPVTPTCAQGETKNANGECVKDTCPIGYIAVPPTTGGAVSNGNLTCKPKPDDCPAGMKYDGAAGKCMNDPDKPCASGQTRGADGTCKKDDDHDGEPDTDADAEKSFSGGDDCNVPPSCAGDPIMCGQARIQWRIDCNTRERVAINGGSCDVVPTCTGESCKAMEYAQLLQQWRTACAVEKLVAKDSTGTADPNVKDIRDALLNGAVGEGDLTGPSEASEESAVDGRLGGEGSPNGLFTDGTGHVGGVPGSDGLDVAGFGYGNSCPQPPQINLMGQSITLDTSVFCNWMSLGGALVMVFAALLSLRIMASGGT